MSKVEYDKFRYTRIDIKKVTDRKEIDTRDIQQMVIETRIEIYLK